MTFRYHTVHTTFIYKYYYKEIKKNSTSPFRVAIVPVTFLKVYADIVFLARRQPGAAGEGVGHVEAGLRALLRPDHREQRPRRDDRPAGGRDRARAHDTPMGARLLGLLTAVVADSSGRHR